MRTGKDYLAGLRDGAREVWAMGKRIEDVTTDPSLARPAQQIAALYDLQFDPAHPELSYVLDDSGSRAGTAFIRPTSQADLRQRGAAFATTARQSFGLMGRAPDFLNCSVMALAEAADFFAQGRQEFGDNIVRYYQHVRDNDLFLTHALTTPQGDRSKASSEQGEAFFHLGVVKETSAGIIVSGARSLATLGPLADEVLIYNIPGLRPGDEKHALAFAVPIATPGIRQILREPYDQGTRLGADHPLAANFEEADSLLVFENVLVPWDRVFLLGDVGLSNRLYAASHLRNHTAHQTSVRGLVKMQFAVGLAVAVARS
ncbi:MAG TPA: 4-hydroxyphenylacetate 3-hydroxylase N-terminal domain-containing protein, partial [Novosphingobium sp.]